MSEGYQCEGRSLKTCPFCVLISCNEEGRKRMTNSELTKQLNMYAVEFRSFMRIKDFPQYEIETQEASVSLADAQGFESVASASYAVDLQKHILTVSTNLGITKDLMFHEFTHILDTETYTKGDKNRCLGLSAFTEYHASQVQLAQLLGATAINEVPTFSMQTVVSTWKGEKSVYQYITEKQQHASDLFNRTDFPANINTLNSALGVLCNYYGLRSICEMYSTDYIEIVDNAAFLRVLSTQHFTTLNRLMHGWFDEQKIELSISLYYNIFSLIARGIRLI